MNIVRHGYTNRSSSAGKPTRLEMPVSCVLRIRCWVNGNGNPSYVLMLEGGDWVYLVDDFGGVNDLGHVPMRVVDRKRDLFAGLGS